MKDGRRPFLSVETPDVPLQSWKIMEELFLEGASFPRREILRLFDPVPGLLCAAGKTWALQFSKV